MLWLPMHPEDIRGSESKCQYVLSNGGQKIFFLDEKCEEVPYFIFKSESS